MAKKVKYTPEELAQISLDNQKNDMLKTVAHGFIPQPTRSFDIGEEVSYGAHLHSVISDKTEDGLLYCVLNEYTSTEKGKFSSQEKEHKSQHWVAWTSIFKKRDPEKFASIPQFAEREEMRLQFYQTGINSLDSLVYHAGLDTQPDYQRGLVWSLEDKQKLIDSIFKGVDIGKFVFIKRDYDRKKNVSEHLYEVLDGKQRVTTILEYLEDRFEYNGYKFSELHPRDQAHIRSYPISVADVTNPTKEQIYRYFLRLNVSGKPIDQKHLDHVSKLLHDEMENKMNEGN